MIRPLAFAASVAVAAWALAPPDSHAEDPGPIRIGVITLLSGPAAGPFGVPARNAADLLAEAPDKGGVVAANEQKGFGGHPIERVPVYEAGGPTEGVTEYRNLVNRQNFDRVPTAFLGAKSPCEKAQKAKNAAPTQDEVIAVFEHVKFESVAGIVDRLRGRGHQAVKSVPYGTIRMIDGKPTLTNVKYYSPEQISPPDGVKSLDWIRSRFKR